MKAVIQRVINASVTVSGNRISEIDQGFLVLLGIENDDTQIDIDWLAGKIARLRVFGDSEGAMNLDLNDIEGAVLVVSQFTLHASTKKGNRPSFIKAARPEVAIPLYENFVKVLQTLVSKKVQTGQFGAMMDVELVNDGPVTILIDTKNRE